MSPPRSPVGRRRAGSGRGAQPRRDAIRRPINARLVRGTWLLVALPLLLAAFTVGRPQPLPPPALPPSFDGETAARLARDLADHFPDRAPGSAGALGAAQWYRDQLRLYGFDTRTDTFGATIPGRGEVELRNVVAVVQGASPRAIVVIAHRDNDGTGPGTNDNASGTAALVELARAYAPLAGPGGLRERPAHDIVFVSSDGGAAGALGAARFAVRSPYAREAVAVVNLDAIAGKNEPRLLFDADRPRTAASELVRTAAVRILEHAGEEPRRPRALAQLLDLAFPFTLREQGVFVARGIPAVTLTTVGDRVEPLFGDTRLDPERLAEVGRAADALIGSLDGGLELEETTTSHIYLGRRVVHGWAIQLVLIAALLPFVIGAVDLFARCRRRRIPLAGAMRSLRARLLYWASAGCVVLVAARFWLFPESERGRPVAFADGVATPGGLALTVLATLLAVGWLLSRERLLPRRAATAAEQLAGHTVALLALGLIALLVAATNPYSLVLLLPSLYAWLWLPQALTAPRLVRAGLVVAGLTGPFVLVAAFGHRHGLGAETPWYLLSLVGSGYVPLLGAAVAFAWLAVAAQLAALAAGRYAAYPQVRSQARPGRLRLLALVTTVRRRRVRGDGRAMEG
jgi:Peptidase family M28